MPVRLLTRLATRRAALLLAVATGPLLAATAAGAEPCYCSSPAGTVVISSPSAGGRLTGTAARIVTRQTTHCFGYSWSMDGVQADVQLAEQQPDGEGVLAWKTDSTRFADGTRSLRLDVFCDNGDDSLSVSRTVEVRNVRPAVALTGPSADQEAFGVVPLEVTATSDPGGSQHVARVDVALDGAPLLSDTTPPYGEDLDTTRLGNGPHTLTATAYDSAGLVGRAAPVTFTVANHTSSADLQAAKDQVAAGSPARLSGIVAVDETGEGVSAVPVSLSARRADQTGWAIVATGSTDEAGAVTFTHLPRATTLYRLVFAGTPQTRGSTSEAITVAVVPRATLTLPSAVRRGAPLSGTLRLDPAAAGQSLVVQRRAAGGAWSNAASLSSSPGSTRITTSFARPGTYEVRVQRRADRTGTATTSNTVRVRVS